MTGTWPKITKQRRLATYHVLVWRKLIALKLLCNIFNFIINIILFYIHVMVAIVCAHSGVCVCTYVCVYIYVYLVYGIFSWYHENIPRKEAERRLRQPKYRPMSFIVSERSDAIGYNQFIV